MIASLEGLCVYSGQDRVVLEINGIGYEVFVTESFASRCIIDRHYRLQTLMIVRENEIFLVGFTTPLEREFCKLLTTISGIGPKAALKILNKYTPADLAACILENDVDSLKKVPGIGPKTAKRLILELNEKISAMSENMSLDTDSLKDRRSQKAAEPESTLPPTALEAVAVLVGLGCTSEEAESAVKAALEAGTAADSSDLVMAAVSELGNN